MPLPKGPMKCYYEVLGVPRDAGADDLKKSYRKLALKWHPDKNLDSQEEATEQFRLVQQAYDVLTDPHERAWYDKHREAILKGGCGFSDNYQDESLNLFQYFTASCYTGYGDDEDGFYTVYRNAFETISSEDYDFMDSEESDCEFPGFGDSQSSYEEVVHSFYAFWESFCTAKSYVWVEDYDTREAPNRRVRRLMEAENKKLREAAKKERNLEIRNLVAFVKKRDKRVQAHRKKLEERIAEVKRLDAERKEKMKQERIKKYENYQETEWSAMSQLEKEMASLEAHFDEEFGDGDEEYASDGSGEDEEEELYYDDLYCVACNKAFKTEKAFANHENSKKHKENLAFLKAEMDAEEAGEDRVKMEDEDLLDNSLLDEDDDLLEEEDAGTPSQTKTKLSKKQKKKRKQQQQLLKANEVEDGDMIKTDDGAVKECNSEEEAEQNDISQNDISSQIDNSQEEPVVEKKEVTENSSSASKQKGKKTKDTKKATEPNGTEEPDRPQHWFCNTCSREFPTRNKMFSHLKATGHQLRTPEDKASTTTSGKKSNKKKGRR